MQKIPHVLWLLGDHERAQNLVILQMMMNSPWPSARCSSTFSCLFHACVSAFKWSAPSLRCKTGNDGTPFNYYYFNQRLSKSFRVISVFVQVKTQFLELSLKCTVLVRKIYDFHHVLFILEQKDRLYIVFHIYLNWPTTPSEMLFSSELLWQQVVWLPLWDLHASEYSFSATSRYACFQLWRHDASFMAFTGWLNSECVDSVLPTAAVTQPSVFTNCC